MANIRILTLAIALGAFFIMASLFGMLITSKNAEAYVIHNPITIIGNSDFTSANGVTGGSGTSLDPYIIDGWEIDGSSSFSAIEIYDTDAYFIIRNVNLHSSLFFGIICDMCTNGIIEDSTITDNFVGLWLENCTNFDLSNSIVSDNYIGLFVYNCDNVTLTNNQIMRNLDTGIFIEATTNLIISNNNIKINYLDGVFAMDSSGIQCSNNNISENGGSGIWLNNTLSSSIVDNTFVDNWLGIDIEFSIGTIVTGNMLFSDGINMWGDSLSHFNSHTISSNYVNGKPIYYYKNEADIIIDNISIGQLLIANCSNISIENIQISNTAIAVMLAFVENASLINNIFTENECGLDLEFSNNITISNNDISNNEWDGVYIENSENCTIFYNVLSSNSPTGIWILSSSNSVIMKNEISYNDVGIELIDSVGFSIYGNNMVENAVQALDNYGSENSWDNGNFEGGNYWSDYNGIDGNYDGIGDTPYLIDFDSRDDYPLMEQSDWEAPTTTVTLVGTPGQNEWYLSAVTVTLEAFDDSSGVNWTQYRLSGGNWEEYNDVISISEDGEYMLEFHSVDFVNNLEETQSIEIKIDQTPPIIEFEQENGTEFNSNALTVSWICSDNMSDLEYIEYCLDGGNFTCCDSNLSIYLLNISEGSHNITLRVFDQAGNIAEVTLWFEVDTVDGSDTQWINSYGLLTLIIVIVIVLILTVTYIILRSKTKQPPLPPNNLLQ